MKPFLKWAGNKYQILAHIEKILPPGKRLIEPFMGSGAVFLNTNYPRYLLADANVDLMNTFLSLKKEGSAFIEYCKTFFVVSNNTEEKFYKLRQQFNTTADRRLKSALFIYLNKHCFNGLCRYNKKGEFNTPFGKYTKPYFPEVEMRYFHQKAKKAIFKIADFVTTMQSAEKGDVVYCDPPYVPLSDTANFTSYSSGGFNVEHQKQLAEMAEQLANKGITVVISNHRTHLTQMLYKKAELTTFDVQRYISCKGANREKVEELLAIFD